MKKFVFCIGVLLLFTIPVYADSSVSIESAISSQKISEQDKSKIETLIQSDKGFYNSLIGVLNDDSNTKLNSNVIVSPITYDYDHIITFDFLSNPALISTYEKQGNLKSNLKASDGYLVPVLQYGMFTNMMVFDKSADSLKFGGIKPIDSDHQNLYNNTKNINLFRSAGITSVKSLEYVSTGMYNVDMIYVDTDDGEYAIVYTNKITAGMSNGLTNEKVYKVSDIIHMLDQNFNLEKIGRINPQNEGTYGGFGAGKKSSPSALLFRLIPYFLILIAATLLIFFIPVFIRRYKAKKQ